MGWAARWRFRAGATSTVVGVALLVSMLAPGSTAYGTAETGPSSEAPGEVLAPETPAVPIPSTDSGPDDELPATDSALPDDGGAADGGAATAGDAVEEMRDDDGTPRGAVGDPLGSESTIEELSTVVTASVPSAEPAWNEAKIIVRAGGDRRPGGRVTGLAGVRFEFYRTGSEHGLRGGSLAGECTTGADGRCGVIVKLSDDGYRYAPGYYYARQVSAPHGWSEGTSWGSDSDHLRHNTGRLTGRTTIELPDNTRSWPNVRDNPPLEVPRCGLDVGYVIDLSNSITRYEGAQAFTSYKEQATALVDSLAGTPTTMTVYTFGTAAPAEGAANVTLPPTSLHRQAEADTVRAKIRGLADTPSIETGYANWDRGLAQTIGQGHDIVVFLTDGEPTASRTNRDGLPVTLQKVEDAVHSANGVKAGGTRIVPVGVTGAATAANRQRLALLSDPSAFGTTSHLGGIRTLIEETASPLVDAAFAGCAASVTVKAQLDQASGRTIPAPAWELTADGAAGSTGTPPEATTGVDGTARFTVSRFSSGVQRVTITPTQQEGYALSRTAGGSHATCTVDGSPVPVVDTDGGFALDVPMKAAVACTITSKPVASDHAPTATEAKVVVRAGGDRLAGGSVTGLPGASFDIYRAPSATALDGGTRVGTCTTGDDGTCGVVIGLADTTAGAAFYGVQTAAPTGWTVAHTWGDADDLLRYSTGLLTGGETRLLPDGTRGGETDDIRHWPQVRDNPDLPPRCGLDIALVYDLSNSVTRPGWQYYEYFEEYKNAGIGVVDALEGTPSRLGLYTYATAASAKGPTNGKLERIPVARPAGAANMRTAIGGLATPPADDDGFTNWDEGMAQLPDDLDVVLFLTDGEPTDSRSTLWAEVGYTAELLAVEEAMHSANAVKAAGTHLVAVGAGPAQTPANQQRLRLLSEDVRVSDFAGLGDLLTTAALESCVGTVNIVKDAIDLPGGEPAPGGPGWEFVPAAAGSGRTPAPVTTGADGTASIRVDLSGHAPDPRTVTITESPREGYALDAQGERNAVCRASDGDPVTVEDAPNGFVVRARYDAAISCRVVNAAVPRPDVTIVKTSTIDPDDGTRPILLNGIDVEWHYAVTNTGNVPLTNLRVTDDRGVDVICPSPATGPAANTITELAPGETLTCSATGPVTPTADAPRHGQRKDMR